jgi:hypothetical protein
MNTMGPISAFVGVAVVTAAVMIGGSLESSATSDGPVASEPVTVPAPTRTVPRPAPISVAEIDDIFALSNLVDPDNVAEVRARVAQVAVRRSGPERAAPTTASVTSPARRAVPKAAEPAARKPAVRVPATPAAPATPAVPASGSEVHRPADRAADRAVDRSSPVNRELRKAEKRAKHVQKRLERELRKAAKKLGSSQHGRR